jgi:hypothetical protein
MRFLLSLSHQNQRNEASFTGRCLYRQISSRLLKKAHLLRFPHPSSLRSLQGSAGASLLRISDALHLGIFEQPAENDFFNKLLDDKLSWS